MSADIDYNCSFSDFLQLLYLKQSDITALGKSLSQAQLQ